LANNLRDSAESIRDAVARREAQNLAGVPDEPTTPETMDEMATDPDANPLGYAQYIGEDLAAKLSENVSGDPGDPSTIRSYPDEGTYVSTDGRVEVSVSYDADTDGEGGMRDASSFSLTIDGKFVDSGPLDDTDRLLDDVITLVEEHFSKKA
jgi:hypothetical protein